MKLYIPTKIYCEENCVANHAAEVAALGTKMMIVTGRHSAVANGSLNDLTTALEKIEFPYVIFNEVEENPSIETVSKAAEIAVAEKVDLFVGIGGGSPMDASKAISFLAKNPEKIAAAETFLFDGSAAEAYPVAEIPTTSGTGSEVTQYAVLTIHSKHTKSGISHHLFPEIAMVDSKYLKTASYNGFTSTCIDALAHLVESRLNTNINEYNKIYAEEGLRVFSTVKNWLCSEESFKEITDEIRAVFMHASVLAGMSIAHTGTSLPHALSYPVTYEMGVAHGKACGIFLPGFVKYYGDQKEAQHVLELLGFADAEEFKAYLETVLGKVDIAPELWERDVNDMMANPGKLKNYPFAIDAETIRLYY